MARVSSSAAAQKSLKTPSNPPRGRFAARERSNFKLQISDFRLWLVVVMVFIVVVLVIVVVICWVSNPTRKTVFRFSRPLAKGTGMRWKLVLLVKMFVFALKLLFLALSPFQGEYLRKQG